MTAPYVGTAACTFVHGQPVPPCQDVREIRQAGVDGYGKIGLGQLPGQFSLIAVGFVTSEQVGTWIGYIAAQQGPTIEICLDSGEILTNATILKIGQPQVTAAATQSAQTRVRVAVPIQGVWGGGD